MSRPSFREMVEETLASGSSRGASLLLCRTPAVIRMLGFSPLNLEMTPKVVHKIASGKAGERPAISPKVIGRFPELIDEPIMILESETLPGSLMVVTTAADDSGFPVIVVIDPERNVDNRVANMVSTAYGKNRVMWFVEQAEAGLLRYVDRKKVKGLGTPDVSSLTLNRQTEPGSQSPLVKSIFGPEDLCNFRAVAAQTACTITPAA